MLTHVDICTALWDYALGHISCNDENDDGDEDSGEGGGASIFCPCLFFNINQCTEIRWYTCNWMFAQSVDGITSFGLSLDGLLFTFYLPGPNGLLHKEPTFINIGVLHQI